jgi:glycosyltransferase involved in cell wall biosynthesis
MAPTLAIALPQGLTANGITAFAVRLVNALASRGHACGLIVHPSDAATIDLGLDPRVRVFGPAGLVPLSNRGGDIDACVPLYRRAIEELATRSGGRVVLAPSNHGDCFGIAAALSRDLADRLRVVGWQHSDNAYDALVLSHYERIIHRFVPVSAHLERVLRERLPTRTGDIRAIHYGVEAPSEMPHRDAKRAGDTLRLVYTGRIEHRQKRVLALPAMMRELAQRGTHARLRILGDGPAMDDLLAACRGMETIEIVGAVSRSRVIEELDRAHAFVLPSRYEGLSVAMLEAMSRGCVPIVTRTESGALEAIEPGVSGIIAEAPPDADEDEAGRALAISIAELWSAGAARIASLAAMAHARARDRFSLDRHVDAVEGLLVDVVNQPARAWRRGERVGFAEGGGGVPADGVERLARLLERLRDRAIVVHGTGEHTRRLERTLLDSPARIVAFADDDRQQWGREMLGRAIVEPARAGETGATDVVLSSWMHQEALWSRRAIYESQGMRVHRIYS